MKKESKATPNNFEEAYAELQTLVAQMESGQMSLEDSLKAYQRGDELLQYCQKALAKVEQQVQILTERSQLQAFDANQE
jgi:exodeoxyribonuclease VII small subunit